MIVSIVIPCFNQARFVGEAVASACAQDWPLLDVIVVDDGSTDGSGGVACRFPVRVMRQPNHGLARARNAGLAAARGDVVIFLDADDRLHPGAARTAVDALSHHPDAAMAFGNCRLIDASGAPMPTNIMSIGERHYEELLRRNYIWTPATAAFRRRALDRAGGFDPRVNPSADYDMYLRVAREWPIVRHDQVVADYRRYDSSMSSDPMLMLTSTLTVLRRQRPFVRDDARLEAAYAEGVERWRAFYGEQLVDRFRSALHDGRYLASLRDAGHLLRLYPRGVAFHLRKKARLYVGSAFRRTAKGS